MMQIALDDILALWQTYLTRDVNTLFLQRKNSSMLNLEYIPMKGKRCSIEFFNINSIINQKKSHNELQKCMPNIPKNHFDSLS